MPKESRSCSRATQKEIQTLYFILIQSGLAYRPLLIQIPGFLWLLAGANAGNGRLGAVRLYQSIGLAPLLLFRSIYDGELESRSLPCHWVSSAYPQGLSVGTSCEDEGS